jgi:hypothetical protein
MNESRMQHACAAAQKKKRKGLEQDAEAVTGEQNGQSGAQQKKARPLPDEEVVRVNPKKKVKAKSSVSLGGQRTSDMMKLLVS